MPTFQLRYSGPADAIETVEAECKEEAKDLARRRLLFSEPGLAIAIMSDGQELDRVIQISKSRDLRH